MNRDSSEDKLKLFFQEFTRKKISGETSVNNDLQLLVSEIPLIVDFLKNELKVEISSAELEPYFLDEFNMPFQRLYYKLFCPEKLKKQPLTIKHLIDVCKNGRWFPPDML